MSKKLKLLKQLKLAQKLCAVYDNADDVRSFAVGYIVAVGEDDYIMETINASGQFDGFACKLVEDIISVETDSQYLTREENLMRARGYARPDRSAFGTDCLNDLLQYAAKNRKICFVELDASGCWDVAGFVVRADEEMFSVECVDAYGKADGLRHIDVDRVYEVRCDGAAERDRETLFLANEEKN